jgi:hypothetical protein
MFIGPSLVPISAVLYISEKTIKRNNTLIDIFGPLFFILWTYNQQNKTIDFSTNHPMNIPNLNKWRSEWFFLLMKSTQKKQKAQMLEKVCCFNGLL